MIKVFIGYDERESVAYHTCVDSIIRSCSQPLQITPLHLANFPDFYHETHDDGSNAFSYTRFLVPYLCGYDGWAIFLDGDMVVRDDLYKLTDHIRADKAVSVVKHDYKTKTEKKYLGAKNENYPCKNWSSVMLWNCGHPANRILTARHVTQAAGSYLHRFQWLHESQVGALPITWNWLESEYEENEFAKIIHYTLGTPCWSEYAETPMAGEWHKAYYDMASALGAEPYDISARAAQEHESCLDSEQTSRTYLER